MKPSITPITLFLFLVLPSLTVASYPDGFYEVGQVIDGDTFDLRDGQGVRLIGINAHENGEKCSDEATQALASLISGQTVYLERDVSDTDGYNRLLRNVYVGGTFVNYEMAYQGFAYAEESPPDLSYASDLKAAEDSASQNGRGCLWAEDADNGTHIFVRGSCYIDSLVYGSAMVNDISDGILLILVIGLIGGTIGVGMAVAYARGPK